MKPASRIETLALAVKMLRASPPLPSDYQHLFSDIPDDATNPLQPIVEAGLEYSLITPKNSRFEPQKRISRAEAYSMILKSVCFPLGDGADWKTVLYDPLKKASIINIAWENFKPNQLILRRELFSIASHASDWANTTGGCMPQICANK